MEKLTFYDINKILERLADSRSSVFELRDFLDSDNSNETNLNNMVSSKFSEEINVIGSFELVEDNENDLEGYGEIPVKKVFYFKNHDIYIQFKGFWSPLPGVQYNSHKEVKPTAKTIVVYE